MLTGDVLTSLRCDCRAQLELSLQKIDARRQASCCTAQRVAARMMNKLRAYELQDAGWTP